MIIMGPMAETGSQLPRQIRMAADERKPANVVPIAGVLLRKRIVAAMAEALKEWPAVPTVDATDQMVELDINMGQIINGMKRAEILEFSEDVSNGRMLFTAKLFSAGEEFFVSAAVERLVPFTGSHVVIRRVWR